ncbi:cupin domain-containing protein [Leptospira stimsonii]|uniref:Cupin domain-containing protein n=1 Tax=Leptospira stimsonii TaxID=2202203 RepID=A0A396YV04_9LEPT|nr:cupin domain-containing protein [Leptospira stimsonii]RHX85743.1 cupin domain-containing protein [Leptospira stimsonii]
MEISTTAPNQRIFDAEQLVRFSDEKATVTEVAVTSLSSIAVWGVRPGQEVPAHTHPDGQDTWIVLRGSLTYFLGGGQSRTISAGQIDIAVPNQIHGAKNLGNVDAVFLSIYSAPTLSVVPALL